MDKKAIRVSPKLIQKSDQSLVLSGLINFQTVMSVYNQGLDLLTRQPTTVVIDLQGVLHGDSSILALLSAWIQYTMIQEKKISFINLPESLKHLIQLSGLEHVFPVKE
jgi:anti-anti-sigma factor